ncbi:YceI family protein [Haliangium sp.]|uniref:YceI family protein n=1 Tax=Haliangium sp. TaxID=2663208 RepID=UPI003D0A9986
MTKMAHTLFALGLTALLATACGKAEDPAKTDDSAQKAEEDQKKAEAEAAAKAAADADYVKVMASHEPAAETDPVEIVFEGFKVTKAEFDPANLEGATAEIEIDLNTLKSDKEKRDGHIKTADYLDVAQFGAATVKVSEVKKAGEKYAAQAEVSVHGQSKSFPVEFEVVETMDDGVRVKGSHTFNRLDFGVGKEPDGENEKVAKDLTVEMQLTLKKG